MEINFINKKLMSTFFQSAIILVFLYFTLFSVLLEVVIENIFTYLQVSAKIHWIAQFQIFFDKREF